MKLTKKTIHLADFFPDELEVFRTEAEAAIQFFYSYLAIHAIAGENKNIYKLINRAPLFWNTVLGALQTSTFIILGRIFDNNSNHNVNRLLKIAQSNMTMFSKEGLAERKRKGSANADEWLEEYLQHVYVPTADDFRRLRRHIAKRRAIYKNTYDELRDKIFAHKEISEEKEVQTLFDKTNIRELEQLLIFLKQLYEVLWELYFNGRKPILRPMRYSVKQIRKRPLPEGRENTLQERLVREIEEFLKTSASVPPKTLNV